MLLAFGGLPAEARAARLIGISVTRDGKPLATGFLADDGSLGPSEVWCCLGTTPLHPVAGVRIVADATHSARATLPGPITIKIDYGGQATVNELQLVHGSARDAGWTVDPGDVERIARGIGLSLPPGGVSGVRAARERRRATEVIRIQVGLWTAVACLGSAFLMRRVVYRPGSSPVATRR